MVLLGHKIEGIWHTGVSVFGKEYFYGMGHGIAHTKPVKISFKEFINAAENLKFIKRCIKFLRVLWHVLED